jgi:Icc-related predicted phosphoesterase
VKTIYITDVHANKGHLKGICGIAYRRGVDCLIMGGDIVPKELPSMDIIEVQRKYLEEEFIPAMAGLKERLPDIRIFLDMGNDDLLCNRTLLETGGEGNLFHLLHMNKLPLTDELDIVGYMNVPVTPYAIKDWEKVDTKRHPFHGKDYRLLGYKSIGGRMRQWYLDTSSEDSIESDMSALSGKVDGPFIFVSHSPPYGTALDMLDDCSHAGSMAIRDFIELWGGRGKLIASFHGHIHESPFVSGSISEDINGVSCYNPGQSNNENVRYILFDAGDVRGSVKLYEGI